MHTVAKRLLAFFLVAGITALSVMGAYLHAQTEEREGIGISPTKLMLDGNPGERVSGEFTVINPGTEAIEYRIYVKDFSVRNEEYEKDFEPVPGATSPVAWFQVPDDSKTLAPGEQQEFGFHINIPEDAVPRGYYAVIFAETTTPEIDDTGVARIKRVGALTYLTVNGGSVERGDIASFDVAKWQRDRPLQANVRVQNEGNVHFDTTGTLYLKDVFGRTVSRSEIGGTILPATIRKFSPQIELNMPFGVYKVEGEVNFLGKTTPLPGKWVVVGSPFWIVLWTVIIVGWVVVLIRWIVRRAKRKKS